MMKQKLFRVLVLETIPTLKAGTVMVLPEHKLYYRPDHKMFFANDGEQFYVDGWYNGYFAIEPLS